MKRLNKILIIFLITAFSITGFNLQPVSAALTDNIVSYWKLDGNSNDSVSTNNGTDTNITYGTSYGKIGQGASFNTSGTSLITLNSQISLGSSSTISAWIYTSNSYKLKAVIGGNTGAGAAYLFYFYDVVDSNYNIYFGKGDGLTQVNYTIATSKFDSKWTHIALTYSGTTLTFYIDGTSQGTKTISGLTPVDYIGTGGASDQRWKGSIDEVGIWSRALTATEITALYNSGNGLQYPFGGASIAGIDEVYIISHR